MTELTFHQLLDRLTKETNDVVKQDDGQTFVKREGLLQQLRAAVFGGMENTGGGAAFGSKPPIDATAVDLLTEITDQAAQVLAKVTNKPTPYGHAESYVRVWAGMVDEGQWFTVTTKATIDNAEKYLEAHPKAPIVFDSPAEFTAYSLLRKWVDRIEDFFNPPSTREIRAECPRCEVRYVYRKKDGQYVQQASLNFIRDKETGSTTEARCSNCDAKWAPPEFEFLAKLIGAKPLPEFADTP